MCFQLINRPRKPIHNLLPRHHQHNLNPRRHPQRTTPQRPLHHRPKTRRIAQLRPSLELLRQLRYQTPRHRRRSTSTVPDPKSEGDGTEAEFDDSAFGGLFGVIELRFVDYGGKEGGYCRGGGLEVRAGGGEEGGGCEDHAPDAEVAVVGYWASL